MTKTYRKKVKVLLCLICLHFCENDILVSAKPQRRYAIAHILLERFAKHLFFYYVFLLLRDCLPC